MKRLAIISGLVIIGILGVSFYPGVMALLGCNKIRLISSTEEVEIVRWRHSAESGDSGSMYVFGKMLLKKESTKKEGENWIEKAAKLGDEDALYWQKMKISGVDPK